MKYTIDTDFAYLVGVYLGDGSTDINGSRYRFQLGVTDKDFYDKTCAILTKMGLHCNHYIRKPQGRKKVYVATVMNKDFVLLLREITSNKEKLPLFINNDSDLAIALINGLLDSEGWVGKTAVNDTRSGYKYSVGINMTSLWIHDVIDIMRSHGVAIGKPYLPKKEKPFHKQRFWYQFNLKSFIRSPFAFSIGRLNDRLSEYTKYSVNKDSDYYSRMGKIGAHKRWHS